MLQLRKRVFKFQMTYQMTYCHFLRLSNGLQPFCSGTLTSLSSRGDKWVSYKKEITLLQSTDFLKNCFIDLLFAWYCVPAGMHLARCSFVCFVDQKNHTACKVPKQCYYMTGTAAAKSNLACEGMIMTDLDYFEINCII